MNRTRRTLVAAAATLALATGTALAADPPGKGITINIGYFPVVSPVPIMRAQHLLEDKGYTVNWVPITQGLPGAASAVAESTQTSTQSQDAPSGLQNQVSLQLTTATQWASAASVAAQISVWNEASSIGGDVAQSNTASASTEASVSSSSHQEIAQTQAGDGSDQAQWAGQVAEVTQSADAVALAGQRDSGNQSSSIDTALSQLNAAGAGAVASVASELVQVVWQDQVGIGHGGQGMTAQR